LPARHSRHAQASPRDSLTKDDHDRLQAGPVGTRQLPLFMRPTQDERRKSFAICRAAHRKDDSACGDDYLQLIEAGRQARSPPNSSDRRNQPPPKSCQRLLPCRWLPGSSNRGVRTPTTTALAWLYLRRKRRQRAGRDIVHVLHRPEMYDPKTIPARRS